MTVSDVIVTLKTRIGEDLVERPSFRGEQGVQIPAGRLLETCMLLKGELGFEMLSDLSGVDTLEGCPRFEVHYQVCSVSNGGGLRLVVPVPDAGLSVPSVVAIWATADWHEREAYDLLGIRFEGHPDLRRILMWEGYPYHPLRKDFPVAGLPAELPVTAEGAGRVEVAPLAGGPFVAPQGDLSAPRREPRSYGTAIEREQAVRDPDRREEI